mmetsp:Transcript_1280/g.1834  ORF Transcript_1280/g.1834 Transcript_1280/m.1834 type:complete len:123 (-) Transcript_1280:155-523(-)|eukprot:CAMPEP_0184862824 /NCGR_PEP_ID=MMETSP0580-20130426/7981_1 /TAXON_ID=1118495 /ORGANISM="Dactyliosolen fragilissimus" /LENGTH=122 /DNA_ID=CAMNT_0027360829 /DNA_START=120 /DNA_END=488 /DNA_ORIENTATION=+
MPFWSSGNNDEPSTKDFTNDDEASFSSAPSSVPLSSGAGAGAMGEMQQFAMAIQQQVLVQQVITDLTDVSFQKCMTSKPSDSLSGSQVACIQSSVMKWLDTNEFMMGRMAKKQQSQQSSQFN